MTGIVTDEVDVANKACKLVGLEPIQTFTQANNPIADFFFEWYELTVHAELEKHPWRFAISDYQISPRSNVPNTKWDSAYVKPADALFIKKVYVEGYENIPVEFDLYDDEIHTYTDDSLTVYIETVRRVSEPFWTALFTTVVTQSLASKLAGSSLLERARLAKEFREAAAMTRMDAMAMQSMQRTNERVRYTMFEKARRGNRGGLM